ncbi:CHAT domain-containing protein [Flavilitoribacter nigricans]|uniref:Uncharacterized protein n=1 Tax=Flavilitoribacter nigricans (strain ATCC 23147 / DSM 23189 / NBRC 102662 / NCIMB 1420 / SS-2) TaxID=1122177 RepID=A0A2D0N1P2_FLAN2|nr:CHAT domain-containing protein [Flavilitoribacter nigricans]PHN02298.1 hypothetical protein CRP01_32895 [Flavilitoribacter nigricans DSM 23189 = NBRC 102662]
MNLVDIQKALIEDELAIAIKGMMAYDHKNGNSKYSNQLIHQSSRFNGNEKSNRNHTISSEFYSRTRNQIRQALQQLLSSFPGYSPDIMQQANEAIILTDDDLPEPPVNPANEILKILMLTSNPSDTGKLQLEKEHSRISTQIQNSDHAGDFPIKSRWAVTLSKFSEALFDEKPLIVHFSGHGDISTAAIQNAGSRGQALEEAPDPQESTGIILTSEDGRESHFVKTSVIRRVFNSMINRHQIPIQAVIFNSCYSEAQAQALAELVPHVIGTTSSINDEAAIAFANGFYSFLTRTRGDIEAAWDNGVNQAMSYDEPEDRFIYFKDGKRVM